MQRISRGWGDFLAILVVSTALCSCAGTRILSRGCYTYEQHGECHARQTREIRERREELKRKREQEHDARIDEAKFERQEENRITEAKKQAWVEFVGLVRRVPWVEIHGDTEVGIMRQGVLILGGRIGRPPAMSADAKPLVIKMNLRTVVGRYHDYCLKVSIDVHDGPDPTPIMSGRGGSCYREYSTTLVEDVQRMAIKEALGDLHRPFYAVTHPAADSSTPSCNTTR